ncbi:MAG: hypothetical protein JXL84_24570 [Deltaproteobacteria bacterium]|nr:hypothetical protein [Deltaproteobacteria bacterium]
MVAFVPSPESTRWTSYFSGREVDQVMISEYCDLSEFLNAVKNRDYLEAIYLADLEATEAERIRYRRKRKEDREEAACPHYADALKAFISYLRYGITHPRLAKEDLEVFRALRDRHFQSEETG